MPSDRNIERRKVEVYAQTVLAAAGDDPQAMVGYVGELEDALELYRGHNTLRRAFEDDSITAENRSALAATAFSPFSEAPREVLSFMAVRGDLELLSRVCSEYTALVEDKLDTVIVTVTTVVELDDHLRQVIEDKLVADFGKKIVLREQIDPAIIGGIIMSARGKRIDASVASQLENARVSLAKSPVGGEL